MFAFPSFLVPAAVHARLLNKLLNREDWARARLTPHSGKTVQFVIGHMSTRLSITSAGLTQVSDMAVMPDVTLSIPSDQLSRLPVLMRSGDPSALTSIMHIQGDAGLAQTVSDLARDLRWDPEDELAGLVGDIPARRIFQGGAILLHTLQKTGRNLAENIGDYLAYESDMVTNRQAVAVWTQDLHALQQRLDKLEQRLDALPSSLATAQQKPAVRGDHHA